ncbi:polysaccharide pyruvyl transferase family protein [Alteromonas gilva]|uniref:Polysaccharide pyruvyl transferase family protein n=1 Tax=Alteromonas gilva TaxID=2987522 RepID=A0ABT5KXR6_9ALTE|nr:polysaccharide pyruvyl transferase family protein [Alteromonas gilva]MDC8829557.1 polysaccharide pyruvyl transferase family protein [Alteromonas gilva]
MKRIKALKISSLSGLNKGDYIISLCIEHLFKINDVEITSIDIEKRSVTNNSSVDKRSSNIALRIIRSNIYLKYFTKIFKLETKTIPSIIKESLKYDLIIFGGGNMLFNQSGCPYLYYFSRLVTEFKDKKRILLYAVGVGPFELPYKKQLKNIVTHSNVILVRDKHSHKLVNDLDIDTSQKNLSIAVDPAFILSDIYPIKISDKKYIAFNIIDFQVMSFHDKNFDLEKLSRNIIEIASRLELEILLLVTSDQDIKITKKIHELILEANIASNYFYIRTDTDYSELYSSVKYSVASRMHSSIFSLSYAIPTVVVNWQHKVKGTLEEVFSDSAPYLISKDFEPDEVTNKLTAIQYIELEESIKSIKEKIYDQASRIIKNEKKSFL